jgi:hypothetical protein
MPLAQWLVLRAEFMPDHHDLQQKESAGAAKQPAEKEFRYGYSTPTSPTVKPEFAA